MLMTSPLSFVLMHGAVMQGVLAKMKQLMTDNQTAASHSFLLDDDSSIPFALEDIPPLIEDKVRGVRLHHAVPPHCRDCTKLSAL